MSSTTTAALKNTGIDVIKPKCDNRNYEFFTLPNNIDVMVVSDPKADTAAAALAVGVGSLADPKEALGLMHFLEHMLFMGSARFKAETDYPNYIASHGGMSNAYTAATETVYYFDIDANFLDGALDRFAQFFIAPLFDESSTDRELNAVHSEHDKNIYNDAWRSWDANRFVMHDDHPAAWFHTGNLTTLKDEPIKQGTDVRSLLIKNYKDTYSANLMKLTIVGKESVEELKKKAITYFSSVKDTNKPSPTFSTKVLRDAAHVIELNPIKQQRAVEFNWALPSDLNYVETQPLNIISHVLGDEGPGSVLSLLKANRWATGLSSGRQTRAEFGSSFVVTVELTELGVLNLHNIARVVYAAFDILGKKTDEEWSRLAAEAMAIDQLNFDNRESYPPADAATAIVCNMLTHKPAYAVAGEALLQRVEIADVRKFLPHFTLDNGYFIVRSQDTDRDIKLFSDEMVELKSNKDELTKIAKVADFAKEEVTCEDLNTQYKSKQWVYNQYYKNRYNKYPLSDKLKVFVMSGLCETDLVTAQANEPVSYAHCTSPSQLVNLPPPNPFIPASSDLLTAADIDAVPTECQIKSRHPKSVFTCCCKVEELPLTLTEDSPDYKLSTFNTEFYNGLAARDTAPLKQPTTIAELKEVVSKLVQDNLIGFDPKHVNTGIGDDKVVSQQDVIDEEVIQTIFAATDEAYGASLPPAVSASKTAVESGSGVSSPVVDDDAQDEDAEEVPEGQGEEEGEEDEDGEEGEEGEGEEGEEGAAAETKLLTLESFFTEKDEKSISQFIPPTQLAVPLPSRHFQITSSRAEIKTKITSSPIVPPIECYYKFTDAYNSPNVDITLRLELPGINFTFISLFTRAINDFLGEKLYPATLCNIRYRITEGQNALTITTSGHRQGAAETFNVLLEALFNPLLFNVELFTRVMDKYQRSLQSVPMSAAYQQCSLHNSAILNKKVPHTTQKIEELEAFVKNMSHYVNLDYFKKHVSNAQMLVIGNVTKPYTMRLAQNAVVLLDLKESLFENITSSEPVIFPDGSNTIALLRNGNPLDNQNGLVNFYFTLESFRTGFGRTNALLKLKERGLYRTPLNEEGTGLDLQAIADGSIFSKMSHYGNILYNYILSHLMSDHCFDSLRTKQQLGYIAMSRHHFNAAGYGIGFLVQSSQNTSYVDQRIEYYLRKELKDYLTTDPKCIASDAGFMTNLAGAQKGLLQRFTALDAEAGFYVTSICGRSYDWFRQLVLGLMVPYIHRHAILGYYNKWFCDLAQRRKFALHVAQTAGYTPENEKAYQDYMAQDVMTSLEEVLGFKNLLPSVKL